VGVHRQSHSSSIVDPFNATPRTHLVSIPCVVNAKCDTCSAIVVSFRPPRNANAMNPHNQPKRKRPYTHRAWGAHSSVRLVRALQEEGMGPLSWLFSRDLHAGEQRRGAARLSEDAAESTGAAGQQRRCLHCPSDGGYSSHGS
jgi:hypothetical protein